MSKDSNAYQFILPTSSAPVTRTINILNSPHIAESLNHGQFLRKCMEGIFRINMGVTAINNLDLAFLHDLAEANREGLNDAFRSGHRLLPVQTDALPV